MNGIERALYGTLFACLLDMEKSPQSRNPEKVKGAKKWMKASAGMLYFIYITKSKEKFKLQWQLVWESLPTELKRWVLKDRPGTPASKILLSHATQSVQSEADIDLILDTLKQVYG